MDSRRFILHEPLIGVNMLLRVYDSKYNSRPAAADILRLLRALGVAYISIFHLEANLTES